MGYIMAKLRHVSITARMFGMILLSLLATIMIFFFSLNHLDNVLWKEKEAKLDALSDVALSIVEQHYQQAKLGLVSDTQAKEQAIAALNRLRYSGKEYFFSFNRSGVMVQHPFAKQLVGTNVLGKKDPNGVALFQVMLERTKDSPSAKVFYMWDKPNATEPSPKMSVVKRFDPWGWVIGTGIYVDDIAVEESQFVQHNLMILGGIWIPVLIILYIISQSISLPLKQTNQALRNIASGEGDLSVRLEHSGHDEVTKLTDYFNEFVAKIQGVIRSVHHSVEQNQQRSEMLARITDQTSQVTQNMQTQTQSVAAAINEMSMSSAQVAENAHQAAQSAAHANDHADEMNTVIRKSIDNVRQLSEELEGASQEAEVLQSNSAKISQILDVITTIADQTNLLALNAAIEAARAGEAGRGFAVVADEVRSLASKTQQSTQEIADITKAIHQSVSQVSSQIGQARDKSIQTSTQTSDVIQAIDTIKEIIAQISGMNEQIATATDEQNAVTTELNHNVTQINEISEENFKKNQEITSITRQLESDAEALEKQIGVFRV
ncbi:methyl-accepting chemotaxis protein [Celerinatantimonas diazotrophica]|uniref:Methyl-accepting chemotaxis sensory transducer with Cache sensor n=1 Tax=Celerinatantimonas diazotrophica TaxID=412034 RepID=A0A4R1J7B7_9GAMM|nr:methyl-accepting chemotaxis protein [Celerinatantimonas diazotrophica]TCK46335.1 methyl-accepting chemotaxis sensory transducer with Cache sensor [Celerinatantimonas diazotrophica]CAG9295291.1 Methyl-accepting chemotaxis protein McpP [Celerinatantimonas diazotrophica]